MCFGVGSCPRRRYSREPGKGPILKQYYSVLAKSIIKCIFILTCVGLYIIV